MMLPSRSVRKRSARARALLRDAGLVAGAFVSALGVVVRDNGRLIQELQAGVGVGDAAEAAGCLIHEQLQDRDEALQVGLLIDREVDLVGGQELLGDRREVVAAALDALVAQRVLLDRLREALRAARVDREVALGLG